MREYVFTRPDRAAMERILAQEPAGPGGVILRLAWLAGLTRDEIAQLRWEQVSFLDSRLELPDRMVPLAPELRSYLWRRYERHAEESPFAAASSRDGRPLRPESISRLARTALDRGGQTGVRLMDLRHDWIIRQLETQDWPAVARISGVEVAALQARFAAFVPEKKPAARAETAQVDEFKLWKVLQAERDTPAGLALWLTWQLGLQAVEIISLTWDQVDFAENVLRLPDREVSLTNAAHRLLLDTRRRQADCGPHVLLTAQSRRPLDLPRLSRITRAALIRGGMEHVSLRDLRRDETREDEDAKILDLAARRGPVSRGEIMTLLGLSKTAVYGRLRRLTDLGRLVRVGGKYYLPGTVVPPEEQPAAVVGYLEQAGFAYRQDICGLLRIEPRQCTLLLKRMVAAGALAQDGQKYFLPPPEERKAE
ncbi:hypothetical protein AALA80_03370 [Oscillospiraceae bacterium 50-60]